MKLFRPSWVQMSSEETGRNLVDCNSKMGEKVQEKENGKKLKKSLGGKIRRQKDSKSL